jgi:hypothetical protein
MNVETIKYFRYKESQLAQCMVLIVVEINTLSWLKKKLIF